jgi:hypothetical protein
MSEGQAMSEGRRELRFEAVDDALAEVERLRTDGYERLGNWSLAQVCWHLGTIVERYLRPAAPEAVPTRAQARLKATFVDAIIAGTAPRDGVADALLVPPADAGDNAIELFHREFARLRDFPHAKTDFGACGPVTLAETQACHLAHAAHHLSFLVPAVEVVRA